MEVFIWPGDKAAEIARVLLDIAGPGGVLTNTDEGAAFVVSEETAREFDRRYYGDPLDINGFFDPSIHTVADVVSYLREADEAERTRVLSAEQDGKARRTVLAWSTTNGTAVS